MDHELFFPSLPSFRGRKPTTDEHYFRAGLKLLDRDSHAALRAFSLAHQLAPAEPRYTSYLGLAMTLSHSHGKEGVEFCERAVETGYYHPDLFHNLGRVYLMSGQRLKARETFLAGLRVDRGSAALRAAVRDMGARRQPVFSVLPRSHPVNQMAGRLLGKIRTIRRSPADR